MSLGGSWVVLSGVICPPIEAIAIVTLLLTLLISKHEPPSRVAELALCGFAWIHLGRCVGLHEPHREWACRFCMNDDGTCLGGHGLQGPGMVCPEETVPQACFVVSTGQHSLFCKRLVSCGA